MSDQLSEHDRTEPSGEPLSVIRRYQRLRAEADRYPDMAEELDACEQQVIDLVRNSPEADRHMGGPGYQALCALLETQLPRLTDFVRFRIGPDSEDIVGITVAATMAAYPEKGMGLRYGRASLWKYLTVSAISAAERQRAKRSRETATDPHRMPEHHSRGPAFTLDYPTGTTECLRWLWVTVSAMPRREAVLVYETQRGRLTSRQLALAAEVDPAQLSSNKDRALKNCRRQMAMTWVAGSMRSTEGNDGGCPELTTRLRTWSPPHLAGTSHYPSVHQHVLGSRRAHLEPCGLCFPVYEEFRTNGTEHILSKFRALPLAAGPEGLRHWLHQQSRAEDTDRRRALADGALGRRPRTLAGDPPAGATATAPEALTLDGASSGGLPAPAGNAAGPSGSPGASAADRPGRHLLSGVGNRLLVPVQNAVARTHLAFTGSDLSAAQQGVRAAVVALAALAAALPLLGGDAPGHSGGHRHAATGTVASGRSTVVRADLPPTFAPPPATGRPSTAPPAPGAGTTPRPPTDGTSPTATPPPPSPDATPDPGTSQHPTPTNPADKPDTPGTPNKPNKPDKPSPSAGHSPTTSTTGTGSGSGTQPPPYRYASAPDLTGSYGVEFTRTNFGNGAEGVPQPYTITLHRLSDPSCPATTPCYQGIWLNTGANNRQEGTFTAGVTVSGDRLHLTGTTPPDYSYNGIQYYDATAPNDNRQALSFSGTFSQASRDDGERAATFTLTRE